MLAILLLSILSAYKEFTLTQNNTSYSIEAKYKDDFYYFKFKDVQSIFKFNIDTDLITKRVTITLKEKKIVLIPENSWIQAGDNFFNLPLAPEIIDNEVFLPLPVLNKLFEYFLDKNIRIEKNKLIVYKTGRQIDKIVIDAGHGGKDPGAVGKNKLKEKDITLAIAKIVVELLEEESGITCILTREVDTFLALGKRADIANDDKASLFLSLHCNAGKRKSACGTEVYFLSPAKTTWERAVEARENASLKYEEKETKGDLESILWDLAQTEFLKESNTLAGKLENHISTLASTEKRGVNQANFYVLRKAYMPACLVEVDFISNPDIETKLKRKDFQFSLAMGIVEGIKEFKKWYEEEMEEQ